MIAISESKLLNARLHNTVRHAKLAAARLVRGATDVPDVLARLIEGGCLAEAARVTAYALPHREAVWWVCMCADHTAPAHLSDADKRSRELAEGWVRIQTKHALQGDGMGPTRRHAVPRRGRGRGVLQRSVTVTACMGGAPPPHLTSRIVSDAIMVAALRGDSAREDLRLAYFLGSANEILVGEAGRLEPSRTDAERWARLGDNHVCPAL